MSPKLNKFILLSLIIFSQTKLHSMFGNLVKSGAKFSKTNLLLKPKTNFNNLRKFSNSKKDSDQLNLEIMDSNQILKDFEKFIPVGSTLRINYTQHHDHSELLNEILNNTERSYFLSKAQMLNVIYQITKILKTQDKELSASKLLLQELTLKRLHEEELLKKFLELKNTEEKSINSKLEKMDKKLDIIWEIARIK